MLLPSHYTPRVCQTSHWLRVSTVVKNYSPHKDWNISVLGQLLRKPGGPWSSHNFWGRGFRTTWYKYILCCLTATPPFPYSILKSSKLEHYHCIWIIVYISPMVAYKQGSAHSSRSSFPCCMHSQPSCQVFHNMQPAD